MMSHLTSPNGALRGHVASEQALPASSHLPDSLNLERSFPRKKHPVNPKRVLLASIFVSGQRLSVNCGLGSPPAVAHIMVQKNLQKKLSFSRKI